MCSATNGRTIPEMMGNLRDAIGIDFSDLDQLSHKAMSQRFRNAERRIEGLKRRDPAQAEVVSAWLRAVRACARREREEDLQEEYNRMLAAGRAQDARRAGITIAPRKTKRPRRLQSDTAGQKQPSPTRRPRRVVIGSATA